MTRDQWDIGVTLAKYLSHTFAPSPSCWQARHTCVTAACYIAKPSDFPMHEFTDYCRRITWAMNIEFRDMCHRATFFSHRTLLVISFTMLLFLAAVLIGLLAGVV